MLDELKIGDGNTQNSAWHLYEITNGPRISHNHVSFWITNCVLGIDAKIMKHTEEGRELEALLGSPEPEPIREYLASVVFKHAPVATILRQLALALAAAREKGSEVRAAEIREALGL